jgi:hypothetical protein
MNRLDGSDIKSNDLCVKELHANFRKEIQTSTVIDDVPQGTGTFPPPSLQAPIGEGLPPMPPGYAAAAAANEAARAAAAAANDAAEMRDVAAAKAPPQSVQRLADPNDATKYFQFNVQEGPTKAPSFWSPKAPPQSAGNSPARPSRHDPIWESQAGKDIQAASQEVGRAAIDLKRFEQQACKIAREKFQRAINQIERKWIPFQKSFLKV